MHYYPLISILRLVQSGVDLYRHWCYAYSMVNQGKQMKTQEVYTLPTELASLFINGDWSIVDYIDDDLYEEAINAFLKELEFDGVDIISMVEDTNRFVKYHDMMDYGVLACDCSDYVVG